MKHCPNCNQDKNESEFYVIHNGKHLSTFCKECEKVRAREWKSNNQQRCNETWNRWRAAHADSYNASRRALRNNPQKKLSMDGRTYITTIMRDKKPLKRFLTEVLCCETRDQFIDYMKSTIQGDYTIDDYGTTLVVDHIIPCSAFDLTDPEQYAKCFHYSNLRLTTRTENAKKYNKIVDKV